MGLSITRSQPVTSRASRNAFTHSPRCPTRTDFDALTLDDGRRQQTASVHSEYHHPPLKTLSHPVSHARCPGTARRFSAATAASETETLAQIPPLPRRSSPSHTGRGSALPYHLRPPPRRTRPCLSRDARDAATTGTQEWRHSIALITGKQSLPSAAGTGRLARSVQQLRRSGLKQTLKRVQSEDDRHITGDADTGSEAPKTLPVE